MAIVSVKRHRVLNRQSHGARCGTGPLEIPAAHQDSHRRDRSKCGGNALTKESIATQHEDRAHQIPLPTATLKDRCFPGASPADSTRPKAEPSSKSSAARTSGIGFAR